MKSITYGFVILLTSLSLNASAQTKQQQKVDSVFKLIKQKFNDLQADSIYALAGDDLKKELSADQFRIVCKNNLFPIGQIVDASLISFQNNKIATYKLLFSTGNTLQLLMSLDDADKLQLFLFQPFKKPLAGKPAPAASTNILKTDIDKEVDPPARAYIQKGNTVGLSIGIYKNNQISTYGYGETVKGNLKIPTADNIFELGSITKTFTATLLAYYVNEGKVTLSDPITKFLPDSVSANPALKGITLEMLSNHTSGLPRLPEDFFTHVKDNLNPYKDYSRKLMFAYLKNCKPATPPGEQYAYSNLAVGLLGDILEKITGKSYEQMVIEDITRPLGMMCTVQHFTPTQKLRFVTVYNEDGNQTPAWDMDVIAPAGALRSTVNNMLLYAKANMISTQTKLSKAMVLTHQITYNKDTKVALGWHIIVVNGVEYYFHDGGTSGCSTFLAFNIEKNVAVVILSNATESTYDVGIDILKRLQ